MRGLLDKLGKPFKRGGKLEKLHPLYEGIDTFLYTPGTVTKGASHVRDSLDLKRLMMTVVWALAPCILFAMYNAGLQANQALASLGATEAEGWRGAIMSGIGYDPDSIVSCFVHGALWFVPIFLVCNIAGGFWEVLFATIRKHEVNEGFLVTGMLFPLTLPPTIPLWQVAVGISFGVVIGKEVFGGTGKNFLNPALTARAFLYFAYPAQITGDTVWTAADGYTGATILGKCAADGMGAVEQTFSLSNAFFGLTPGSLGETSVLACILGAVFLIVSGVGSWRIMLAVLIGSMGLSSVFWTLGSQTNHMFAMSPLWHLCSGGLAFGLVFMATDPVSAAMTNTGKWVYGVLIGVMTILIRVVNPAFPEGVMLAILFGNVFAPLIDYCVVRANITRRQLRAKSS